MTAIFKSSKYFLAMIFLGVLLTACNRNTSDTTQNPNATGAPTNPAPAAPAETAPPPAAPATPAPDTSSTTPPSGSSDTAGTTSSSASDMAHKAGDAVEDSVVTAKVKAALLADSEVKGTEIKVETNQGNVSLSGNVDSQAQIDSALRITRGIEGVKNVDNKLAVKAG